MPGMNIRNPDETSEILNGIADQDSWLIDGFGRMDVMARRFHLADKIVFVDFPLWRHYWWCTKRQIKSLWQPREELPEGCNEATLIYTLELYRILWRVHTEIRPKLIALFGDETIKRKVITIASYEDWATIKNQGLN